MILPTANIIRLARQHMGASIRDLAEFAGVNALELRRVEHRQLEPSDEFLRKVAVALFCEVDDLREPTTPLPPPVSFPKTLERGDCIIIQDAASSFRVEHRGELIGGAVTLAFAEAIVRDRSMFPVAPPRRAEAPDHA